MSTALRLTVDEYERMIARGDFDQTEKHIELIYGELVETNPAGPVHDDLVTYLNHWSTFSTTSKQCRVRIQSGMGIPEFDSQPEPDVLWVKPRRYMHRHPRASDVLLVIEVSDSSMAFDRKTKSKLYGQARIGEYWIVDVQKQRVHVFQRPSANGFETCLAFGIGESVAPRAFPSAVLDISELFTAETEEE